MRRTLFRTACLLYFGWMAADIASVLILGHRIEGVHYLSASYRYRHMMADWTEASIRDPFLFLTLSLAAWWITFFVLRNQVMASAERAHEAAAFILSISLLPALWIVPLFTYDSYDLDLNLSWVGSMFFANVVFFLYPLYQGFMRTYSMKHRET